MLDVKGTKTEENLMKAFADESEARNKYTFYAEQARNDGYEQIARMLEEIADNETSHAKMWYRLLNGGIGTTAENIGNAIDGESLEVNETYKNYANDARDEGLDEIAALFDGVASIEANHNRRLRKLLDNIENDNVFSRNGEENWECIICGYTTTSRKAPEICPVCGYNKSYFKISEENF